MPEYFLGIDYGEKKLGIAIGQTLTQSANPLTTLKNNHDIWLQLEQLTIQWNIKAIVIGLPLTEVGDEQEITKIVRKFALKLENKLTIKIYLHDERYTSFIAERVFKEQRKNGLKRAKDKSQLDATAAQIILQSWLEEQ